jgi:hypothetical protein
MDLGLKGKIALVGTTAYVIGFAVSFWLPDPKESDLPD